MDGGFQNASSVVDGLRPCRGLAHYQTGTGIATKVMLIFDFKKLRKYSFQVYIAFVQ
jgi:hypothetical protein